MLDHTCPKCGETKPEQQMYRPNECVACRNFRMRAYRAAKPAKIRMINQRSYQGNREKRIADARAYALANPPDPERRRQTGRAWYAANRARLAAVKRAWQDANHDLVAETRRRAACRRRARLRGLPTEPYALADIIARDGTVCVLCEGELDFSAKWPEPGAVTVEHLECLAWANSPGDVLTNVAAACFRCNNGRRTRPHPRAAAKRAALVAARESNPSTAPSEATTEYAEVVVHAVKVTHT